MALGIVAMVVVASLATIWSTAPNLAAAEVPQAPAAKGGLPPLKVDRGAPLLLEEPKAKKTTKKGPVADNQACFVCHANYQEEELVTVHADNNVGCIKCHGESLPHRNDENNTTPPDKMYPATAIDKMCGECHDEHNAPAKKVLARWQERCPKKGADQIVCTDCHGDHRLKLRTVRWDKATGKLLPAEKAAKPAAK
jgi:hypothetical protein